MRRVHDENASLVSLVRTVLSCVDPIRETTPVQTGSLVLLMDKLLEFLEPKPEPQAEKIAEKAHRTVSEFMALAKTAEKDRDDNQVQAKGTAPVKKWS